MSDLGRVVPPYPRTTCTASDCSHSVLNEIDGAYLHTDLDTGKLVVLCGTCSANAELHAPNRLPLVAL